MGEGAPHSVDERLGSICPPQLPRVPPTLSEWKPYDPPEPRNRNSLVPPTLSEWEPSDPDQPAPDAFEFFKAGEGAPHSVDERLGSICPPQLPRVSPTLSEWKPYDPLEPRNRSSPVPPTLSEWKPPDPSEPETLAEINQHRTPPCFSEMGEGAPHSVDERLGSICPPQLPRVPPTLSEWKPYDPPEPRNRNSLVPPTLSEWEPSDPGEPETLAEEECRLLLAHVTRSKCASGFPEGDAQPSPHLPLSPRRWASYPQQKELPRERKQKTLN
ncbi:proteoglycan 4-like [Camponotus floridanus]|uniref:proteoglycan 4-like n=1 Tax=Camponotus floridanus TaxID=104421 RepID=UPI000DC68740|nr:proteoglycan 4-like [Camponotus floridanus]